MAVGCHLLTEKRLLGGCGEECFCLIQLQEGVLPLNNVITWWKRADLIVREMGWRLQKLAEDLKFRSPDLL